MLGKFIEDPDHVEGGGSISGIKLLNHTTVLSGEKIRQQVEGKLKNIGGIFSNLSGCKYYGYEIHMGKSSEEQPVLCQINNVYGTYVHGFFDSDGIVKAIVDALAAYKNVTISTENVIDFHSYKEQEYDKLAATMREYLDMDKIYEIMGIKNDKR